MTKIIITVTVLTLVILFTTPAWACPSGYTACGNKGQLCCPR